MGKDDGLSDLLSNTFLFKGLAGISYAVYGIRRRVDKWNEERDEAEVTERAKYLEGAAGIEAVSSAAVAYLIGTCGLLAACQCSKKDSAHKQLWIFGTSRSEDDLLQLDRKLGRSFVRLEGGEWTEPSSVDAPRESCILYRMASKALCDAVREVLERSLLKRQYLRIGSELVLPRSEENESLSHYIETFHYGKEAGVVGALVSIKRSNLRALEKEDVESLNGRMVVTSPHAESGRLVTTKTVGSNLAASVLKRWNEAGLLDLENGDEKQSGDDVGSEGDVIYVDMDNGLQAPFPSRVVLLTQPVQQASTEEVEDDSVWDAHMKGRPRKRPRAELADIDNETHNDSIGSENLLADPDVLGDANELFGFFGDSELEVRNSHAHRDREEEEENDGELETELMDVGQSRQTQRLLSGWSNRRFVGRGNGEHVQEANEKMPPSLSSSAPETYVPMRLLDKFGKESLMGSDDCEDPVNGRQSVTDSESESVPVPPEIRPTLKTVQFEQKTLKDMSVNHGAAPSSIPIDCLSVCRALVSNSLVTSDQRYTTTTTTTGSPAAGGMTASVEVLQRTDPKRQELVNLLNLIEMQVMGRSCPEDETVMLGSPLDEKSSCLPLGTARRALFQLYNVFRSTCLSGTGLFKGTDKRVEVLGPLKMDDGLYNVITLEPPRLCLGYQGDWVETSSCIVPFWEKAGLEPYGNSKNVVYAAIAPSKLAAEAKEFFRDLQTAYQECSFGNHAALEDSELSLVTEGDDESLSADELQLKLFQNYKKLIVGVYAKLGAQHDRRIENHYIIYIISPFSARDKERLGVLLRVMASALLLPTGGNVITSNASGHLPPRPTRPVYMKVIPRESLLLSSTVTTDKSRWPLRAQLMKNYAFAVYSMIRRKRLMNNVEEGMGLCANSSVPDDFWSPVTPEHVNGNTAMSTPTNSKSAILALSNDDVSTQSNAGVGTACGVLPGNASVVQEVTTTSMLYEPALVLAGVGWHLEEGSGNGEVVFHLCYQLNVKSKRYTYSWTDSRGELLDVSSMSCAAVSNRNARRGTFNVMWTRGRRWWLPFVRKTRVVITKIGKITEDEREDWELLVRKVLDDVIEPREVALVRRFPSTLTAMRTGIDETIIFEKVPRGACKPEDPVDDDNSEAGFAQTLCSISLVELFEDKVLQLLPLPITDLTSSTPKTRDMVVVIANSSTRDCEATAYIERAPRALRDSDRDEGQLRLNLISHFGSRTPNDKHSDWDGKDPTEIVAVIAKNFYDLCMVATPPCWPLEAWQSKWPLHAHIVRAHAELTTIALTASSVLNSHCNLQVDAKKTSK